MASERPVERPIERRGIVTPFAREKGDFANATDEQLIVSHVRQILGTRCSDGLDIVGEIPFDPEFGSLLYKLRHQNFKPVLRYQAHAYVVRALERWEPRVRVLTIDLTDEPRRIVIRTTFALIDAVGRSSGELFSVETIVLKAAS